MRRICIAVLSLAIVGTIVYVAVKAVEKHRISRQHAAALDALGKRLASGNGRDGPAITNLALEPNPPVDTLIEALASTKLRAFSARTLGLMRERRAVGMLIKEMNRSQDPWCAWALGKIGDEQAVAPMIQQPEQSTEQLMAAGAALTPAQPSTNCSLVERVMAQHRVAHTEFEIETIRALGEFRDARAIEPLIARLKACIYNCYGNPPMACCDALVQIGLPAVPGLIAALKDSDQPTQQCILEILGDIGDAKAVKPIIECLGQPHAPGPHGFENQFNEIGLLALAKIGSAEAMEFLATHTVKYDRDSQLSKLYVEALLRRSPDSLYALLPVATAWHHIGDKAIALLSRLKGDPKAIAALVEHVCDYGPNNVSGEVLVSIGAPAIDELAASLKSHPGYESYAISLLGRVNDVRSRPPLWAIVRSNASGDTRGEALVVLARLKDEAVVPEARAWLSARPRNVNVMAPAITALGMMGDRDSLPRIAEIARTPLADELDENQAQSLNRARVAAIQALVALDAPEAAAVAAQVAAEPLKPKYFSKRLYAPPCRTGPARETHKAHPWPIGRVSPTPPGDVRPHATPTKVFIQTRAIAGQMRSPKLRSRRSSRSTPRIPSRSF